MTTIELTFTIADEYADDDHPMGVTNEGFEAIYAALRGIAEDIDIARKEGSE